MKYVLILALFLFVAGAVYWRLRPYLKMARRLFGAVREARRVSTGGTADDLPRRQPARPATGEKLVRCASCGTWLPASRAVTLRPPTPPTARTPASNAPPTHAARRASPRHKQR